MINGISLTNIFSWLVFGLLVGIVVHYVDKNEVRGGLLGTVILGILGALAGGWLASSFFGITTIGFDFQGFVIAVIGGLILSYLYRLLFRSGRIRSNDQPQ